MKPFRLIPDDTKIGFMRLSRFGFFVSGLLCLASLLLFFFVGLNVGVDFKGGTVVSIRTEQPANIDELRGKIDGLGLGSAELQEYGSPNDILIRIEAQAGGDEAQQAAVDKTQRRPWAQALNTAALKSWDQKYQASLPSRASSPWSLSIFCVLFYIWFQFEWQFAVGAVLSLLHDVVLSIGLFCLIGLEFNLSDHCRNSDHRRLLLERHGCGLRPHP